MKTVSDFGFEVSSREIDSLFHWLIDSLMARELGAWIQ
jgi:hypothetical protein